jgi:hypothetical protein
MVKKIDLAERNERIFALRENGNALNEIGNLFHLSKERVRQIHLEIKEKKENFDLWPPLKKVFSRRIQNALESYFVGSDILGNPQKIVAAGRDGIERIKNIGKKSIREIALALYELGYIKHPNEWLKPYRRIRNS